MSVSQTEKMTIYVQSRGLPSRYDYQWQSEKQAPLIDLPPLQIPGISTAELNSFCLILCRSNDSLYLLACGLLSGRKDINHRNIRNTVMWKLNNPDNNDEVKFRTLAAMILRDRKTRIDLIDLAIEFSKDDEYGYSVTWDSLDPDNLIKGESLAKSDSALLAPDKLEYSDDNVEKIADRLLNCSLPANKKNLVIVKDDKSQLVLDESRVCLTTSNVLYELMKSERNEISINLFIQNITPIFNGFKKINFKFALLLFIGLLASGIAQIANISSDSQPLSQIENITINISFTQNKVDTVVYTLTGDLNSSSIEEVKLINRDRQTVISSGSLNPGSKTWEIRYKPKLRTDCQSKLSIQGFDKNGEVGDKIAIPSICM